MTCLGAHSTWEGAGSAGHGALSRDLSFFQVIVAAGAAAGGAASECMHDHLWAKLFQMEEDFQLEDELEVASDAAVAGLLSSDEVEAFIANSSAAATTAPTTAPTTASHTITSPTSTDFDMAVAAEFDKVTARSEAYDTALEARIQGEAERGAKAMMQKFERQVVRKWIEGGLQLFQQQMEVQVQQQVEAHSREIEQHFRTEPVHARGLNIRGQCVP